MSRTKEHCARVAVDHSTHFLYDSNSMQHVITLPATKSNLTYSLSSSLHHIFSMQRCVQANNRAGPSGMFTIARLRHFFKKTEQKRRHWIFNGLRRSGKMRLGNLSS